MLHVENEPSAKEIPTLTRIRIASLPRKCLSRPEYCTWLVHGSGTRQCHTQRPLRSCTSRYMSLRHAYKAETTTRERILYSSDTLKRPLKHVFKIIQSPAVQSRNPTARHAPLLVRSAEYPSLTTTVLHLIYPHTPQALSSSSRPPPPPSTTISSNAC